MTSKTWHAVVEITADPGYCMHVRVFPIWLRLHKRLSNEIRIYKRWPPSSSRHFSVNWPFYATSYFDESDD